MSQVTAITLTDGAATPLNRVFSFARQDGQLYTYQNRASGIMAGYDTLTAQTKLPGNGSRATVVSLKLVTPILEQTSPSTATGIQPAPTVAYNCIGKLEFVLTERSTLQNRKDLLTMMRDLIDEAIVTSNVQDLDPIWS
jgi:hypothetical protein